MPDSAPVFPTASGSTPVGSFMQNILDQVKADTPGDFSIDDDPCPIAPKRLPEGHLLHGYRLKRCLGEGGFGVTYLAIEELLSRCVVIKENFPHSLCERESGSLDIHLKDSTNTGSWEWALNNFLREVRLLSTLDHPNIARVYSYFEAHRTAYYVTQYIDGKCLADIAQDYANHHLTIPQESIYSLMVHILDALDYLHSLKLLHRDIKPDNILVTRIGRPVLIDFGAAREEYGDISSGVVESVGYSPPEQGTPDGKMGFWTDLYSFGATLYFVLTGTSPTASRQRLLYDTMEPLSSNARLRSIYHPRILASIDKALSPDISRRYQSAAEWISDLRG